MLAKAAPPVEGLSRVPPHYAAQALITAGLEAGRLDLAAVEALHPGFRVAAAPLLANWTEVGLGEIVHHHFQPSRAGAFWITQTDRRLLRRAADRHRRPRASAHA